MSRATRQRSGRKPRRRSTAPSRPLGRLGRGVLEFILVLVLLFFAASLLGLLRAPNQAPPADQLPLGTAPARVFPALVTGMRPAPAETGLAARPAPAAVRVHIANGCGVNRLAARMRSELQENGFDVCGISNAGCTDYAETVVIDRCGERWKAEAVCRHLQSNFGVGRIVLQQRPTPEADVLVVLGLDLGSDPNMLATP